MEEQQKRAVENAWRIHDAQLTWTSQVDGKASFVLAIEAAVTGGVVALAGDGRRLTSLEPGWTLGLFVAGVACLVTALASVALAVRPRLRHTADAKKGEVDYLYFGHAMQHTPQAIRSHLEAGDMLGVLCRQIVATSRVAWLKHRLLQVSVTLAAGGTALIAAAAALNG